MNKAETGKIIELAPIRRHREYEKQKSEIQKTVEFGSIAQVVEMIENGEVDQKMLFKRKNSTETELFMLKKICELMEQTDIDAQSQDRAESEIALLKEERNDLKRQLVKAKQIIERLASRKDTNT
ncbi:MAG: hypothetical protein A2359_03845 [Candidatus Moranbacteria bacterium RIFOXYB1_FULL_43_19]|nr:MAG: hypothetical protein A2184_00775 [Candidatus Moranbacteria bacterium RIFOXYA1_FULL_44_7]OGI27787.1 MAG: hypothetical protein A2359_03845 [Candidatus Moranbacteria bacterium RIFOXYB1_FULL_43_19]OGI33996.1 MAG: hypothetical protein A2420_02535 [Candidatus Moranbacteria bacterium RIFOXYC1_FULL_44_13]OGI37709.1 MAG: hypothetical protein A2612_03030 [Candidatus Moranbacteria bacterium RIFOXYD1_FULL_44_12]